jgi:hypothetical protein
VDVCGCEVVTKRLIRCCLLGVVGFAISTSLSDNLGARGEALTSSCVCYELCI